MLLAAFLLGVTGSLHCAGMCSPLALAVANRNSPAMYSRLMYNLGRISTYGVLGAIVATLGYTLPLAKYQNVLSIMMGSALIIMSIIGITGARIPFLTRALVKFTGSLKAAFSKHLGKKRIGTMLLLGAINGLLPCGLTFLALAFCITLTNPQEGFAYMFVFGLGTLPVMLGLVSLADVAKNRMNWSISKVTTGLMMVSGVLLIARVFFVHLPDHKHGMDLIDIVICR